MKIKVIKRVLFLVLLLLPLLIMLANGFLPYINGTFDFSSVSEFNFVSNLEKTSKSYFDFGRTWIFTCINSINRYVGFEIGDYALQYFIVNYISYGICLYLLWICIDCFIALPTFLKRFIDRGVYSE